MRCPKCGWPNISGATNCKKCGNQLIAAEEEQNFDSQSTSFSPYDDQQTSAPLPAEEPIALESGMNRTVLETDVFASRKVSTENCPKCGYPVRPDAEYCPNCNCYLPGGQEAPSAAPAPKQPEAAPASSGYEHTVMVNFPQDAVPPSPEDLQMPDPATIPDFEMPKPSEPVEANLVEEAPELPQPKEEANKSVESIVEENVAEAKAALNRMPTSMNFDMPEPSPAHGTVNPYMQNYVPTPEFSLTPVKKINEKKDFSKIEFEGESVIVNRDNTDPENYSITSRKQAEFTCEDGQWYLKDMSDQHTTFILVSRKMPLQDGDVILMGNRLFEFHI